MFRLFIALSIWASLFLLAATGLAGCSRSGPPQAAAPEAPQVGVMTVQPRRVAITTALPGRTAPTMIAEVRPQVTGIIQSRNFTEGSEVTAGATLYRLDPATYQAAYESARASIAKSEASLQSARRRAERYK
jgi:membrane fusion protein (multidrug efflux system)